MSYKPGEIYFVREIDREGKFSNFVKIGLVTSPRTSQERLLEHQTGNPRRLDLPASNIVTTDAVSFVEARLHRTFATERIGGEWFEFHSEERLIEVIDESKRISAEASKAKELFLKAEALEKIPSNGLLISATGDDLENVKLLLIAKEQSKVLDEIEDDITAKLEKAKEQGKELGAAAKEKTVTYKPKFDKQKFMEDYPELAAELMVAKSSWSQRFLIKYKLEAGWSFEPEFSDEVAAIRTLVDNSEEPVDLLDPQLRLARLRAFCDWDELISATKLKIACGENEGIEGICTWKRSATTTESFSEEALRSKDLDLYNAYLMDEVTKTYIVPAKGSKRR